MTARCYESSVYGFFIKQLLGTTEAMLVEMLDQYHRLPQNLYLGWNGKLTEGARSTLDQSRGHVQKLSKDFIISPPLSYSTYFSRLCIVFLVYTNVLCNVENACNFYTRQEWRKGKKMEISVIAVSIKAFCVNVFVAFHAGTCFAHRWIRISQSNLFYVYLSNFLKKEWIC